MAASLALRIGAKLVRSVRGRHKLYVSSQHPLLCRLDFSNPVRVDEEALLAGKTSYLYRDPPRAGELLPEPAFWAAVKAFAAQNKMSMQKALIELLWVQVDYQANPPHPLVQYVLPIP